MKEITVIEIITEFSPAVSGVLNVNVYKLTETESPKESDITEGLKFLEEDDENYYKNSNHQFKKECIGIGTYIPLKKQLKIF